MKLFKKVIGQLLRRAMWRASRGYMAGQSLDNALRFCRTLRAKGFPTTVGYWEPNGIEPDKIAHEYIRVLEAIGTPTYDCSCMVKVPSLAYRSELLQQVVAVARTRGAELVFDSIEVGMAEPILSMVEKVVDQSKNFCFTLPARWPRSVSDASRIVELGITARVITGIWPDPEHPRVDPDKGFLAIIDQLAGRVRRVGIATHNPVLAREAARRLSATQTNFELQVLFGLPMKAVAEMANSLGVPLRVYVPYGNPLDPSILIDRIRRNPSMLPDVGRRFLFGPHLEVPVRTTGRS